jgi:biopolymer transport protein ExbD
MNDKNYFSIGTAERSSNATVNITSLMDVLTIILIFLLTNYSDNPPDQNPPKGITIPIIAAKSNKKISGKFSKEIRIVFYKTKIEVKDEIIPFEDFNSQEDQILELVSKKLAELIEPLTEKEKGRSAIILLADKDIKYNMISSLIKAASIAGVTHVEMLGTFEEKE